MNVSLPDQMKSWVEDQTRDGRYRNVSDQVRDLIREDQDRKNTIAEIQEAVDQGLAGGPPDPFDMAAWFDSKK